MEKVRKEVKTVLLIDDDPDDYDLVTEAMQEIDDSIRVEMLQYVDEVNDDFISRFDLVLLDINMPGRDGFYWLDFLRQRGHHELPIVMYTNSLSPMHIARAYTEGANLYFPKPETFLSLKRRLNDLLRLDWSRPGVITKEYGTQGTFRTFPG